MRRLCVGAIGSVVFLGALAPAASAQAPEQQGCPAFELQELREAAGGRALGEALAGLASPGTPGGPGQSIQRFCEPYRP